MRRPKLLFLSPFPYGASSGQGGATVCFNALRLLAAEHEIGIVAFSQNQAMNAADLRDMQAHTVFVRVVPLRISRGKVLWAKLRSVFTSVPEHAVYFESAAMSAALAEVVQDFVPDVVIVQFPQMAQYLCQLTGSHTIQDVQDAFCVSWYRRACSAQGHLKRLYAYKQWLNWVAYERRNYARASQVWTLSEQDRLGLTAFNPSLRPVTVGLPLCENTEPVGEEAGICTVGFVGSYGHPPNVEALAWLIDEIVPAVSAQQPNTRYLVAGRNPPEALVRRAPASVEFLGFVESLSVFYKQCAVVVAPLRSGGGVKIKVAEALCFGKPVVTTSVGIEGVDVKNGEGVFIADSTSEFVDLVFNLLRDPLWRHRIAKQTANIAKAQFAWSDWLSRVRHLLVTIRNSASE